MFTITPELPSDAPAIGALLDLAFGPERHDKVVYRLREGVPSLSDLCLTGRIDDALIATLRFWPALVDGRDPVLLLGPIAVRQELRGLGYGIDLLNHGLELAADSGWGAVALVGDEPYYARVGFSRAAAQNLSLPGLQQPERLLARELRPDALKTMSGPIGQARCVRAA